MLTSTVAFGLMAITIRLASSTIATAEIAFFRNAFGLLTLLPLILRPGKPLPRTRQLPRYFARTLIGLASMLCGFLGDRPSAPVAGHLALLLHAVIRHGAGSGVAA